MHGRSRRVKTFANVVTPICIFMALGTAAYAATSTIVGDDGVIHACYGTKGKAKGTLRVVKPGTKCKRRETALRWNQRGEEGPVGAAGRDGAPGAPGKDGAPGPAGADGSDGQQGETGPAGPAGAQGERGPAGPAGPTGPQGERGLAGPAGPTGPRGERGLAGPAGPTGPAGAKGETGPAGPTGPQGPGATKIVIENHTGLRSVTFGNYTFSAWCSSVDYLISVYGPTGSVLQISGMKSVNDGNHSLFSTGRELQPSSAHGFVLNGAPDGGYARMSATMVLNHGTSGVYSVVFDAIWDRRPTQDVCSVRGTATPAA